MQQVYGAPIGDQDVNIIGAYLAVTYGSAKESDAKVQAASNPSPAPAATGDAMVLLQNHGCLSCHAIDHKVAGPAYHDVAARYRGDPQALTRIASSIEHGSRGKWGDMPMPPFAQLSAQELQTLTTFILNQ